MIYWLLTVGIVAYCSNDPDNQNDQGQCSQPILNGKLQTFQASCLAHVTEHVRLEGVNLPGGQTVTIYAFASAKGKEDGMELSFVGGQGQTGQILIKHPNVDEPFLIRNQTMNLGSTYCVDLHIREVPIHILIWKDKNCDLQGSSHAFTLIKNIIFDSQLQRDTDQGNWRGQSNNPSGRFFNYRATSDKAQVALIIGKKSIFADQ